MASLPPVSDMLRVDIVGATGNDIKTLNRLHIGYSGSAPSNSDLNTYCTTIHNSWNTNIKPLVDTDSGLEEIIVTDISSSTGARGSNATSIVGTRSGSFLGASTCVLVNYEISRRYRGGKPRSYVKAGVSSDMSSSQTWSATFIGLFNTGWDAFVDSMLAVTVGPCTTTAPYNVSYYEGFTVFTGPTGRARNISKLRTGGPVTDIISSFACTGKVASQRRRNLN